MSVKPEGLLGDIKKLMFFIIQCKLKVWFSFLFLTFNIINQLCHTIMHQGAQWLSGRVLDSGPKGRGFEPHRRHCVVVLEQDTFILA